MNEYMQSINYENQNIRSMEIDGEIHVCAKDVALALQFQNPADAISKHCKGVAIRYPLSTAGGTQEARFIKEPDLYRLILRANTAEAEKFQDFVCEELLPQYRKQGFYIGRSATASQRELLSLEFKANAVRARIEAERFELKAQQVFEIDGAVPLMDWIQSHRPELNTKQAANLSRTLKQVIAQELDKPVTNMSVPRRGKRLCARPEDIAAAMDTLNNRKQLESN